MIYRLWSKRFAKSWSLENDADRLNFFQIAMERIYRTFSYLREQWFLAWVILICSFTLWNPWDLLVPWGKFLSKNHAPEIGIATIFVLSGLELKRTHLSEAIRDWRCLMLALSSIFVIAPLIAWLLAHLTTSVGIRLGLFLVGVLPTTLATGIVMGTATGANTAQMLLITLISNIVCVITIPLQLPFLMGKNEMSMVIPQASMSLLLLGLVVLPLLCGLFLRKKFAPQIDNHSRPLSVYSRFIILGMIYLSISGGQQNILRQWNETQVAIGLAFLFHLLLAAIVWTSLSFLRLQRRRRNGVFFTSIQKTLPLATWIQTTYFHEYGLVLIVCLCYHISQVVVDSFFVARLNKPFSS
jgi:sodium/bile acid cotransporter 7